MDDRLGKLPTASNRLRSLFFLLRPALLLLCRATRIAIGYAADSGFTLHFNYSNRQGPVAGNFTGSEMTGARPIK